MGLIRKLKVSPEDISMGKAYMFSAERPMAEIAFAARSNERIKYAP